MFSPCGLKTLHSFEDFSIKSSPSSSLSSVKLKNLVYTLIVSHTSRIIGALSKVKTIIIDILKDKKNKRKKIIMGSFRLHYNWCSSKSFHHVIPDSTTRYLYYDSNWNTTNRVIVADKQEGGNGEDFPDSELVGYLQWLEENVDDGGSKIIISTTKEKESNHDEIDMIAEMFIANCHDKFRLEKQESDRRFQEMLARSL
ncbi:hypothetical protein Lal_00029686 [Lupinus albus]|uniref:Uncharacterized protein n=1 Tax=Lupinus albus TaxID=3870 RepID=A0A6A5MVY6_LUPAL|nr:hypothetical protein Lalb_Chr07g0188981 [Lupinus albus]KAF1876338.1 hypothetical protein Lal_00029686 [Lupinus albus]